MSDFQLGDYVKANENLGNRLAPDYTKAGAIGEVVSIDENPFPIGVVFDNGVHWFVNPNEIEHLTLPGE